MDAPGWAKESKALPVSGGPVIREVRGGVQNLRVVVREVRRCEVHGQDRLARSVCPDDADADRFVFFFQVDSVFLAAGSFFEPQELIEGRNAELDRLRHGARSPGSRTSRRSLPVS